MIITDEFKTEIYRNYQPKVLNFITGKVNNINLAEDLCSDIFIKIYEKIETFDETKASVSTWIFTITRNTLTDYYRTRKISGGEIPETMDDGSSIEDDFCNEETLETLADALEKLNERERDIVILHYYSGLTLKEISTRMDISYSYTKLLHNNALSHLQKFF